MKLKEVPSALSREMALDKLEKRLRKIEMRIYLLNYHKKYIQTGSIKPLNHVLISVGLLSYAVGWPTELRHLRRAELKAMGMEHESYWLLISLLHNKLGLGFSLLEHISGLSYSHHQIFNDEMKAVFRKLHILRYVKIL